MRPRPPILLHFNPIFGHILQKYLYSDFSQLIWLYKPSTGSKGCRLSKKSWGYRVSFRVMLKKHVSAQNLLEIQKIAYFWVFLPHTWLGRVLIVFFSINKRTSVRCSSFLYLYTFISDFINGFVRGGDLRICLVLEIHITHYAWYLKNCSSFGSNFFMM